MQGRLPAFRRPLEKILDEKEKEYEAIHLESLPGIARAA
jgi:hypothetical protein